MAVIWRGGDKSKLKPQFLSDVMKLLGDSPFTWYVTSGYRSNEEQEKLWEKYKRGGPKAAPPGRSAHNYGLAVDVVLDGSPDPGLQPDWVPNDDDGWAWLFKAIWDHPRLHSGRHFNDAPHIERSGWKEHIHD